jgi:hypothetical protein
LLAGDLLSIRDGPAVRDSGLTSFVARDARRSALVTDFVITPGGFPSPSRTW